MVRYLPAILILAAGALALGVSLPVVEVTNLAIFSDRFSIAEAAWQLLIEGEYLLAIVIVVLSAVFPMGKIIAAGILWRQVQAGLHPNSAWIGRLEFCGRWACTDILLIAVAIVVTKRTGIADASMAFGLWFFAASIVLVAIATQLLKRQLATHTSSVVATP